MRVAVLGLGYVGFTAACCIASQGHVIVGVDINQSKLRDLRAGVARALQYISADCGANTPLIDSLLRSNEAHKFRLFQRAVEGLQPGASILLAGISFKAGTDDLRESPNVDLARALLREGYQVSIFDPSVNATKLVGANLGYAFANLPTLERLLVTKEQAAAMRFDRVVASNATVRTLALPQGQDVIDLGTLA